ncbi:MAG: thiamine diphosphokinase, partial [Clostridiales bacterium]|nr:thiamine diphosphokinase [Clostridiales bacterium]
MNQVIKIIIRADGLHDTKNKQAVCHVVCAGEYSGSIAEPQAGDYVIAADGGLRHLERAGVAPDLIVGDFDSLGHTPDAGNIVKLNVEKDDTDTMSAVRIGLKRGFRLFYIHCGMGGRLDHTLANIQTLAFILRAGGMGVLFGEKEAAVLTDGVLEFGADMK